MLDTTSLMMLQPSLLEALDGPMLDAVLHRARWLQTARADQLSPADELDWYCWLLLGGRGSGKTRSGAEYIGWEMISRPGIRVALMAPTFGDVRDTMIEGDSGLLNCIPDSFLKGNDATYNRSMGEVMLSNGSRAKAFSSENPNRLRGPQHHLGWWDEIAACENLEDMTSNFLMGLRLGKSPKYICTSTPRPLKILKEMISDPSTITRRVSTFANIAHLPAKMIQELKKRYEGTSTGRQELYAEILDDLEDSLVTQAMIRYAADHPFKELLSRLEMTRIVIGVDPAGSHKKESDETGIVAAGKNRADEGILLADVSGSYSPNDWARRAIQLYYAWGANYIVAETNNGGDMVENTILTLDPNVKVKKVVASKSKHVRFEPLSALYQQGRVWHMDKYEILEQQLMGFTYTGYEKDGSPDRADAAVWAFSELFFENWRMAPLVAPTGVTKERGVAAQLGVPLLRPPPTQLASNRRAPIVGVHS